MPTFDVRCDNIEEISDIRFSDDNWFCSVSKDDSGVYFADREGDRVTDIDTKQAVENLIKALQKAIELGWFNA